MTTAVIACAAVGSRAQTDRIAQLKARYYTASATAEKLSTLSALYEEHQTLNKDTLWSYAETGLKLSASAGDATAYSLAAIAKANAFLRFGNTDSAQAIITGELPKNPVTNPATRPLYFLLAALKVDCYGDAANYKDALAELYTIVRQAEQYGDALTLMRNMNTLGVINYNLNHLPEAFSWHFKALSYNGDDPRYDAATAANCINLAETYRWVEKPDSATFYINKAVALCNRIENLYYLANALRIKSSLERDAGRFEAAEGLMLQAIALRQRTEGESPRSNERLALSNLYMRWKKYDKAIRLLTEDLQKGAQPSPHAAPGRNSPDIMRVYYLKSLAKCYELSGNFKQDAAALSQLIDAKDSFYEANSAAAIAELQTKYELQKKETTITQQQLDIIRKNYLLYGAILLSVLVAGIAMLLFINYRRRQRYRVERLMDAEKQAAAKAVAEAQEGERIRISADLHDNLGAYAAAIASNIDHLSGAGSPATSGQALGELRGNAQAMVAQLSDTIWVLKREALSMTAISDRLKVFLQRIQPSYPDITIDVEEDIETDVAFSSAQAFQLFKILQEAITNALRHAACTEVRIRFQSAAAWAVSVADDGKGFGEAFREGNGLRSMERRAAGAGWTVTWQQDKGTVVCIRPTTN